MKGYLIGNINVKNAESYREYAKAAEPIVRAYGGRYLVRGGKAEPLEDTKAWRLVVLEFPSLADAEKFYRSPEYRKIMHLRTDNAETHLFALAEGYSS